MTSPVAAALPPPPSADLAGRVLLRLGLARAPRPDFTGLRAVYAAWRAAAPFDNVRKMIALAGDAAEPLPGMVPAEFFAAWLADGAGGTCWPTNAALTALLVALGFDARPVGAAMRDLGVVNHGTCAVRLPEGDFLVDSSMLLGEPLPLAAEGYVRDDLPQRVEFERDGGDPVFWFDVPSNDEPMPCRLVVDPIPYATTVENYARSRAKSPFNRRLYARRVVDGRLTTLHGAILARTENGVRRTSTLDEAGILAFLRGPLGLAAPLLARWCDVGGLAASLAPNDDPPPPPATRPPPSRRR